jgi:nucleoside-diphosphate-sugar epimerase
MTEKLSVFGGSGFIGSKFCELYSDKVIKINREARSPQTNQILYFISTVDNYNIHADIHVDVNTNIGILLDVLDNLSLEEKQNITFNFISSWFVYGKNNEIPFREDYSKCNPTGFYSITKHCAEQLLISFCQTYDINYRIFRLSNVIGEGDEKISKKKNALQFLIKELVENRDVHLYYGGEVLRDYMYVEDVCRAINFCIDNAPKNEIINIGSGRPHRFLDLINHAKEYSGSKSKIIKMNPTKFHDIVQVRHSYLDTSKLNSYGFSSNFSIEDSIEKIVDFYKNKKIKSDDFMMTL